MHVYYYVWNETEYRVASTCYTCKQWAITQCAIFNDRLDGEYAVVESASPHLESIKSFD